MPFRSSSSGSCQSCKTVRRHFGFTEARQAMVARGVPIGGYVRFVGDRKAAKSLAAQPPPTPAGISGRRAGRQISLRRSQLLRPRGSAASSLAVRPKPRASCPATSTRASTTARPRVRRRSSISSAWGPRTRSRLRSGAAAQDDDQRKANLWRCSTGRPCGRAGAFGSRSPGIEPTCELFVPASPGRFGRRSHAHERSSPSPATELVRDRANLAGPVFGTDRNSAHVKWRSVARIRRLRPIRRDRFGGAIDQ